MVCEFKEHSLWKKMKFWKTQRFIEACTGFIEWINSAYSLNFIKFQIM
jgi:hypothetical protein